MLTERVILALLDLKKAFDFINHDLLSKLKHYGIRGTPLKWLCNYLSNHTQKCKVNSTQSTLQLITPRVPQGSILGPILFILLMMYSSLLLLILSYILMQMTLQ